MTPVEAPRPRGMVYFPIFWAAFMTYWVIHHYLQGNHGTAIIMLAFCVVALWFTVQSWGIPAFRVSDTEVMIAHALAFPKSSFRVDPDQVRSVRQIRINALTFDLLDGSEQTVTLSTLPMEKLGALIAALRELFGDRFHGTE